MCVKLHLLPTSLGFPPKSNINNHDHFRFHPAQNNTSHVGIFPLPERCRFLFIEDSVHLLTSIIQQIYQQKIMVSWHSGIIIRHVPLKLVFQNNFCPMFSSCSLYLNHGFRKFRNFFRNLGGPLDHSNLKVIPFHLKLRSEIHTIAATNQPMQATITIRCWRATVWWFWNPKQPVEGIVVYSIIKGFHASQVVWDFWTINSMSTTL